jgi:hypothetical protein
MQTLETVAFHLVPGTDPAAFLAAARGTEAALRRQPGFLSRMLTRGDDGTWTDLVLWASHPEALAAAEAVMSDPAFAPFGAMIDMAGARMSHAPLVWRMD